MNRIASRLDWRLDDISLFHELTEAESDEFEIVESELEKLISNMSLSGTTDDQIDRREDWFDVDHNASKSLSERRAFLVSKLQGQGVLTKSAIKTMAAAFGYGDVDIDDKSAPYTVRIVFKDVVGVPDGIESFIAAIEELKPAHLVFEYVYRYNTWQDYVNFNHTLDEWQNDIQITWEGILTYSESVVNAASLLVEKAGAKIRKAVAKINGSNK